MASTGPEVAVPEPPETPATSVELHTNRFLQAVDPDGAVVVFTKMLVEGAAVDARFASAFPRLWSLVKEWRSLPEADQETLMAVCYLRATAQIEGAPVQALATREGAWTALASHMKIARELESDFLQVLATSTRERATAGSPLSRRLDEAFGPVGLLQERLAGTGANLLAALEALGTAVDYLSDPDAGPPDPATDLDVGRQLYAWIILMILLITFPDDSSKS